MVKRTFRVVTRALTLMAPCIPPAFVAFYFVDAQRFDHWSKDLELFGRVASGVVGFTTFGLLWILALINRPRLEAIVARLSEAFAKPQTEMYVISTFVLTSVAFAARVPSYAAVGLVVSSLPLWLPTGSIRAVLFWIAAALPFTFYSVVSSLVLVGIPTLPLTVAMWRTIGFHWNTAAGETPDKIGAARGLYYVGALGAVAAMIGVAELVVGGPQPGFRFP